MKWISDYVFEHGQITNIPLIQESPGNNGEVSHPAYLNNIKRNSPADVDENFEEVLVEMDGGDASTSQLHYRVSLNLFHQYNKNQQTRKSKMWFNFHY